MAKRTPEPAEARPSAVERGIPQPIVDALVDVMGTDDGDITLDSTLVGDLGMDSLDITELAMKLEEHLNLDDDTINDAHVEWWVTVKDVIATVRRVGGKV